MRSVLVRFIRDDEGQDLIEYGLLASIIAVAGALILPAIKTAMGVKFGDMGDGLNGLWTPKDPGT